MQRAAREGIEIVSVGFDLMDDDADIMTAYAAAITSRTRVMQLTHMSHWTGLAHFPPNGCATLLGTTASCQSWTPRRPLHRCQSTSEIWAVTTSSRASHKWLGAPVGNGMLIVRDELIDETWPLLAHLRSSAAANRQVRSLESRHLQLGAPGRDHPRDPCSSIHRRGAQSTHACSELHPLLGGASREAFQDFFSSTHLLTPRSLGGVSLFSIAGVNSQIVEQQLRRDHQVHVKYRRVGTLEGLRVSPHIYMLKSELSHIRGHRLQAVVEKLSAGGS